MMLSHLPDGHEAIKVSAAMAVATSEPHSFARSPGVSAASLPGTTSSASTPEWPSTSVIPTALGNGARTENTNGLLRQFMPKSSDLSVHSKEDLDRIARSLTERPRKTLGFMNPSEKLAELLALTG